MAGTIKKTMIFLGLAENDEQLEEQKSSQRAEESAPQRRDPEWDDRTVERRHSAPASSRREYDDAPQRHTAPSPSEQPSRQAPRSGSTEFSQASRRPSPQQRTATVTPLKPAHDYNDEESTVHQITTIHPQSYNDAKLIGDSFRQGIPVIMNVTDIQESEAKRLVDFSAGLVFGLNGRISRVTNKVFLLTPEEIDVKAQGNDQQPGDDDPIMATR